MLFIVRLNSSFPVILLNNYLLKFRTLTNFPLISELKNL